MTITSVDLGFALVLGGLLIAYCEFIWVGRIVFGLVGATLFLTGASMLAKTPAPRDSLFLFAASTLGFLIEAFWRRSFVAGTAAFAMLAWGAGRLGASPTTFLPATIVFSVLTILLLKVAKRARRIKLSDIS